MEEAQGWLLLVEEGERRCLGIWALAAARGIPVRKVLRQRGWSKSTFYRKVDGGSAHIAPSWASAGLRCVSRRGSNWSQHTRQPLARGPGDVEAVGLGPLLDPEVAHAIKQRFYHRQGQRRIMHRTQVKGDARPV